MFPPAAASCQCSLEQQPVLYLSLEQQPVANGPSSSSQLPMVPRAAASCQWSIEEQPVANGPSSSSQLPMVPRGAASCQCSLEQQPVANVPSSSSQLPMFPRGVARRQCHIFMRMQPTMRCVQAPACEAESTSFRSMK